jgi:predicted lactoylglutathione lyase
LVFFGTGPGAPMIAVGMPYDGEAATHGNGTMLAIPVGSRENVDKIYAAALALGASDEGAPGERGAGFYGGYFRDFDHNKITVCHIG